MRLPGGHAAFRAPVSRPWRRSSAAVAACGSCRTRAPAWGRTAGPARCWSTSCRRCGRSGGSGAGGHERGGQGGPRFVAGLRTFASVPNGLDSLPQKQVSLQKGPRPGFLSGPLSPEWGWRVCAGGTEALLRARLIGVAHRPHKEPHFVSRHLCASWKLKVSLASPSPRSLGAAYAPGTGRDKHPRSFCRLACLHQAGPWPGHSGVGTVRPQPPAGLVHEPDLKGSLGRAVLTSEPTARH